MSHGLRSAEYGGRGTTEIHFLEKKFVHGGGSVTECCRDAASKCPQSLARHDKPFSESFKDLTIVPIILTVKRRSDLTRALTLVTLSSVSDVQGLSERGLSSTLSRPPKNALWHLKTCALDTACSP